MLKFIGEGATVPLPRLRSDSTQASRLVGERESGELDELEEHDESTLRGKAQLVKSLHGMPETRLFQSRQCHPQRTKNI